MLPELAAKNVAAKDVTIVVDRSGSMTGDAIEHARRAAADMIRILDSRDRVNVISFSDEVDPLFKAPQQLDDDTRTRAIRFAERLKEGGGTDIALALKTAIASQDRKQGRPRVIVFITDGQSDTKQALDAAAADTGDVRLFTIGLGNQVDRPLLERLANLKRGRFIYIERASSIESDVSKLAATISKPLLLDVSLEVDGAQAVRLYPRSIGDLFAEDELFVTGRIRGTGTAKFTLKGKLAGKEVEFTRSVDLGKAQQRPWVGRLWAQSRVQHLLEEIALGTQEKQEMTNEVIELALAYNFVTPYTSFLAIPESELGAMKGTVEAARERKKKIMADNEDAASLGRGQATSTTLGVDMTQNIPAPGRSFSGASPDMGGQDDEESMEGAPLASSGEVRRKQGCAGCTTGSPSNAGLLLVVALLLLRRRRR
jgi:Ca-activated chloride channel homolog